MNTGWLWVSVGIVVGVVQVCLLLRTARGSPQSTLCWAPVRLALVCGAMLMAALHQQLLETAAGWVAAVGLGTVWAVKVIRWI